MTSFSTNLEQCPNLACKRRRPKGGWGRILSPGQVFDRSYTIHKLLAMGGGGITYLVRELDESDNEVGPRLAIKALFANREQGSYLRRLATEAQILQEMNHPNIVEYRGFVHRTGRTPYLVTRFEAGGSLLDHIHRVGPLPVKEAAAIGCQICKALKKAHETDVIHRDLKPENVLLSEVVEPGTIPHIRVVDFGIAKVNSSLNSNLTRAGAFVGTPHFASPEQFIGANVGPTSDVYSVGAMLHFCMMGRNLVQFADRLAPEDGYQLLIDSLPAAVHRPDDPPEDVERMNAVLAIITDPRPTNRCSASELCAMLDAISQGDAPDLSIVPSPPPSDPPKPVLTLEDAATTPTPPPTDPNPDPSHTPDPEPAPTARRSRGCLFGAIALVPLALGGVLLLFLLGVFETEPTVDTSLPMLDGHETDPEEKEDYRRIYASLEHFKDHLQEVCEIPDGTDLLLELQLSPAEESRSRIVAIRVERGDGACVQETLRRAQVNRAQDRAIRFPKQLTWP